jgi:AraC-like DNA-binding protein
MSQAKSSISELPSRWISLYGGAVNGSLATLDMFVRGIAMGAMTVSAISFLRSDVARRIRLTTVLLCVSLVAWLITESETLWSAFDHAYPIVIPAYPVAGLFWLFVLVVFEDRPLTPANLSPAVLLLVSGFVTVLAPPPEQDWLWAARNAAGGLLSLHAALVIAQGWNGDLLEGRRRLRGPILGFAAVFSAANVAFAFLHRLYPDGPWLLLSAGQPFGGAIFTVLIVAVSVLFLQARPSVIGAPQRASTQADPRAEASERLMLQKLNDLMAGGGWRREGLTIGAVAGELGVPEHRLRRLINRSLGHRNFADFVNGHRIEAAKARLADPREARTTVATVAFDLGYGSLGPFNRAFRAATGSTPTEWRRQALAGSPEMQNAV